MLILAESAEVYAGPCQTRKMNLFAQIINALKGDLKTCQTSEMELILQVVIGHSKGEFRILPNM